jgi:hypothetical protein
VDKSCKLNDKSKIRENSGKLFQNFRLIALNFWVSFDQIIPSQHIEISTCPRENYSSFQTIE